MKLYEDAFERILTLQENSIRANLKISTFTYTTRFSPRIELIGTYYGLLFKSVFSLDRWLQWRPKEELIQQIIKAQREDFKALSSEDQLRLLVMCGSRAYCSINKVIIQDKAEITLYFVGQYVRKIDIAGPVSLLENAISFNGVITPYERFRKQMKTVIGNLTPKDLLTTTMPVSFLGRDWDVNEFRLIDSRAIVVNVNGEEVSVWSISTNTLPIATANGRFLDTATSKQLYDIVESLGRNLV